MSSTQTQRKGFFDQFLDFMMIWRLDRTKVFRVISENDKKFGWTNGGAGIKPDWHLSMWKLNY